jgi:hypothetical protein
MKTVQITLSLTVLLTFSGLIETMGQWNTNGNNINNTNTGNVGIGNSAPSTLLHVAKNMTEPTITVQNLGSNGGATYTMIDNASGANWKFKATLSGGFKIRDHANSLDVFVIEPNSAANVLYINSAGTIGIGTATPDNSSLVDMSSASKGFLPPRMTQAQIGTITSPANGLVVYCTTDDKFYAFVASADTWKEILFGSQTISPTCGSLTINHVAGTVAPVTKTVTYGTVANIPGTPSKCWITSNLGASNQATAVDDDTEPSAGWYWQFNRKQGFKHDGTTRTPNTTWIFSINESSNWTAAKDPCTLQLGAGWRLPTSTEWTNVDASGNWTDSNGPWDSGLKLHAAGYLYASTSERADIGYSGHYWSSTQFDNLYSWFLDFSGDCATVYNEKARAQTVRCLKD